MRNNLVSTPSKNSPSVYQTVEEGQEGGTSWRQQRAELRDDDVPDSHHENCPPTNPHEANKEQQCDDPRRSTVSPRVKLLLNREFVFQSSKLGFYNSLEMRLASPKTEVPMNGQNKPPTYLRPPSFTETPREAAEEQKVIVEDVQVQDVVQDVRVQEPIQDNKVQKAVRDSKVQKVDQGNRVTEVNVVENETVQKGNQVVKVPQVVESARTQKGNQNVKVPQEMERTRVQKVVDDVPDTMSVTSLFYDDYSTAHTRTGVEVDVVREEEDETELDAYSVGHSIFSRTRQLIHKTGSVETSFPEDPNKWLDAASVVGEEHLVMSATVESREADALTDKGDADTFLDNLVSHTVSYEGSYLNQNQHHQLVWQSHDLTETLTETGSVFDKSKHSGRIHCSPFDDLDETEEDTDEQGNDIAMDQLFPSDPMWTIRCEMERQELENATKTKAAQNYSEPNQALKQDPFSVASTHEKVHSMQEPNVSPTPNMKGHESPTRKTIIAEFQAPVHVADVVNKDTREIRVDGKNDFNKEPVVGAKNPFDSMAFNPFVGTQDEDDDDTAAVYTYSKDDESYALPQKDYETPNPQQNSDRVARHEVPVQVQNPFESYDDDSLVDIDGQSRGTKDSDELIVETEKSVPLSSNYVNPFDDLSIGGQEELGPPKTTVATYINPFDDGPEDGALVNKNQTIGAAKKSTNPFDTFDDDMSLDRTVDPVKTSPKVADKKATMDKTPPEQDSKASNARSMIHGAKATNLYTMVMMQSSPTPQAAATKATQSTPETTDVTIECNKDQKSTSRGGCNNNSSRSETRTTILPESENGDNGGVDDIFNQALLPPSTQEGPLVDSDDDDCYIEDDDDDHHHEVDNDSDLSDNSDQYEDGADAMYDDEEGDGLGESWQSSSQLLYALESDARNNQVQTAVGNSNKVVAAAPTTKDAPKPSHTPTNKNHFVVSKKLDDDEVSMESDRDAYDAFMRDTGKHDPYEATASMEESDQQTCFDDQAHPDSEALSCFGEYDGDDDTQTYADDGTVSGLKVLGCLHCSALEEEMMILKAQHQTELLERDLQDEEVLNNMMLMREYIEHLESDPNSLSRFSQHSFSESRSRTNSMTEVELEKSLSELSKDEKSPNFQLFELKARVRFLEEENQRLKEEQTDSASPDAQALMARIRELEHEREENEKIKATNDELQRRVQELESELEKSNSETNEELKRRVQDLEEQLDLSKQETRDDLKHQIEELEEERDLLCTKIEAQEASVALMTQEEEELKKKVQRLENELQLVKLERETETLPVRGPKEQLPPIV